MLASASISCGHYSCPSCYTSRPAPCLWLGTPPPRSFLRLELGWGTQKPLQEGFTEEQTPEPSHEDRPTPTKRPGRGPRRPRSRQRPAGESRRDAHRRQVWTAGARHVAPPLTGKPRAAPVTIGSSPRHLLFRKTEERTAPQRLPCTDRSRP